MSKKLITLKAEDLQNTWDNSCSDIRKSLELMYPDFFEKDETYCSGDRFLIFNEECILAIASEGIKEKMVFIRLDNGARIKSSHFNVEYAGMATSKEIVIFLGKSINFRKIES